jgi:DNA-3-methyladenine glycosylase
MKLSRLPRTFFARDTRVVARELLGKVLVRDMPDGTRLMGRVVEVEAYRQDDQASHSFRGRTARTVPMFGMAGVAYVYFTYGMHHCMNVVTEDEGIGAAVLFRALEPLAGVETMRTLRLAGRADVKLDDTALCRGPGNVCKALAIDRSLSGYDMHQSDSVLFVAADDAAVDEIRTSARIGVSGDAIAKTAPWRFYIPGNPCVSGAKRMRL